MVTIAGTNNNLEQIRWSCRRGMLELDKILMHFCDLSYVNLSVEGQKNFILLLTYTDQELYDWLILGVNLPQDGCLQDLILLIRYFSSKTIQSEAEISCGFV